MHPVYVGNVLLAFGLLVAARPPGAAAATLAAAVVAFYGVLAARETSQLHGLPTRESSPMRLAALARSERSSWATTAAFLVLASI